MRAKQMEPCFTLNCTAKGFAGIDSPPPTPNILHTTVQCICAVRRNVKQASRYSSLAQENSFAHGRFGDPSFDGRRRTVREERYVYKLVIMLETTHHAPRVKWFVSQKYQQTANKTRNTQVSGL